jgi:polynucleotide 5'-hydroxyl-kinase GRC3/NOL9
VLSAHCEEENRLNTIEVPEQWRELVRKIEKTGGPVLVIGAPDTGKTSLTRFLVSELASRGERVGYIDGDMGQSLLGPPTTLGMALLDGPFEGFDRLETAGVYFVGSTSPRSHGLETLVGLKRLLESSQTNENRLTVVDTTGYVTGKDALELKYQKTDLLGPRHIVALQRELEIEHILSVLEGREGAMIHRLPSPVAVQRRSPEERRRYRWQRFKDYFKRVRLDRVDLKRTNLTGVHRVKGPQEDQEGLLLGLNGTDNFLVTLGIVENLDRMRGVLSCLVPSTADLGVVRSVRLGSVRIDLSEETNGERLLRFEG